MTHIYACDQASVSPPLDQHACVNFEMKNIGFGPYKYIKFSF